MVKFKEFCNLLLVVLVLSANNAQAQQKTIGMERTVVSIGEFDPDIVYDKNTGEKISQNKVIKLLRENPNQPLEEVYDKAGRIERYLYDKNNHATVTVPDRNAMAKKGEVFPEFLFRTSTGRQIDSEELTGKITLLRFMGHAEDYTLKMEEIKELNEKIKSSPHKEKIEAFILFGNDIKSIEKIFTLKDSNFEIIPDADNFHKKFNVSRMPVTLVLEPDLTVEDWYTYSEDINLEKIFEEQ